MLPAPPEQHVFFIITPRTAMKHQHRLTQTRSLTCSIAALCILLAMFSSNILLAQNPAYVFAGQVGGTGSDDGNAIAADASGNIYVTGTFQGTVDFDPGTGTASLTSSGGTLDMFIASYDSTGNYRWAFRVGAAGDDAGTSIALDGSGNVVVAGYFNGAADFDPGSGTASRGSSGITSTFVARYSSSGTYLWAFAIATGGFPSAVAIDGSGNIALTGAFRGSCDFNPGSGTATLASAKLRGVYTDDIFVARYTSSGSYLWAFRLGETDADWGCGVAVDGSGNIYVTGRFFGTVDFNPGSATNNLTSAGGMDMFVAKYSSAGAYGWASRVGGNEGGEDVGYAVAVDGSGNVVVTGSRNSSIFIGGFTSSGNANWSFVPAVGSGRAVAIDGSGDIHVTGQFVGSGDFDPGSGTATLAAADMSETFVAKYTSSGSYLWAFATASQTTPVRSFAIGRGLAINSSGEIHVTGILRGISDFDPGSGTATLTSVQSSTGVYSHDIFIAKYREVILPRRALDQIANNSESLRMQIAPNPFISSLALRCDGGSAPVRIEIIDMMGRVVESIDEVAPGGEIHLGESLPAGAYLVRVIEGEAVRQMMVQKVR
jgi:hypothetical protein